MSLFQKDHASTISLCEKVDKDFPTGDVVQGKS
jgi:hypothetical protein